MELTKSMVCDREEPSQLVPFSVDTGHFVTCRGYVLVVKFGAAVPTTLLISSTRRLKFFHFEPPSRCRERSYVASVGASSFKKGFEMAE
jgi:hypothetical protein